MIQTLKFVKLSNRKEILILLASVLLSSIGMIIFVVQFSYVITPKSDFYNYYRGARSLLSGDSIYPSLIIQTPFIALFFAPLAILPYTYAAIIWSTLLFIFYIGTLIIIFYNLKVISSFPWKFLMISIALCWHPFLSNISLGQLSILLSILLIGSWSLLRHEHECLAGFLLGLAALIKLFPGIFILFLLLMGYRKALVAALVTILLGMTVTVLAVGWQDITYYFTHVLLNSPKEFILIPINTSISGTVSRLFVDGYWVRPLIAFPQLATILIILTSLGLFTFLCFQIMHIKRTAMGLDTTFSMTILAMLLLSPITWAHNFPMLLLPISLLLVDFMKSAQKERLLFISSFILLSLPDIEMARSLIQHYSPNPLPWYAGMPFLAPTFGLILLWYLLIRHDWSTRLYIA